MKLGHYFPAGKAHKIDWCKNLSTELGIEGPKMNEPAADIAAVQADLQGIVDMNKSVDDARNALNKLLAARNEFEEAAGKRIRDYIRRLKTSPLYTPAIGKILGILRTVFSDDLTNARVVLKAVITGRQVRISFTKKGNLHALNIYGRIGGTGQFAMLATVTKNPYFDDRPVTAEGITELREYYGMPVSDNKEVGQPSEVIAVNFKG